MKSLSDQHRALREEIGSYGEGIYQATRFCDAVCQSCANDTFQVLFDEDAGCALRDCVSCQSRHFVGDSENYADEAVLCGAECTCGGSVFRLSVGVALYRESEDVRWLYLGLSCVACGLAGVYADWKNEYPGVEDFLSRV